MAGISNEAKKKMLDVILRSSEKPVYVALSTGPIDQNTPLFAIPECSDEGYHRELLALSSPATSGDGLLVSCANVGSITFGPWTATEEVTNIFLVDQDGVVYAEVPVESKIMMAGGQFIIPDGGLVIGLGVG